MPIVVDSPHSGIAYPPDFGAVAPRHAILTSWDAFVDELWAGAPERGCALVGARFPRAYIDPNRAVTDIDAALLAEPWPEPLAPQSYTRRGMGLIRRYALPGVPLYDRKLSLDEVRHRIDTYYLPYRRALADAAEPLYAKHGALWHVDCHSMKSRGNAMNLDAGAARPDVVVSDRLGTSADPAFTRWTADWFAHAGYRVRINAPYQGGDLLNALAAPARRRHSIQIEFNRALYMNETAFDKHAGFAALKRTVDAYLDALAAHVRAQLPPPRGEGVSR
ncbi:N-formylglutamate amidohydrolase [Burkholderia pseudomallei]|uniref:N-formylglutamate amidohydrolase n=1 Tax=Burkholderia pseudomallei TaxID=28450 RepID=UPI001C4C8492|nr:N-formylglutamate amidohydrolase [Burkholderia pseudomallei]MCW0142027.1 N-formylglutamate amidohydrolase [Burkholderia pseudomallei]MDV2120187.1 N-formylglutamate amidohydrolase [Burkholderia pseudomallei]MDV2155881.1 N-formylglutamate amidohydrolase [Burkholderia pseudomallei]MDV2231896.1 N-formylglutamate amidohydrolase [Burkholderia pseudomallei]